MLFQKYVKFLKKSILLAVTAISKDNFISQDHMPIRGTLLSDFESGQITTMVEIGLKIPDKAKRLKRSYNCI